MISELRSRFYYDPKTGQLYHRRLNRLCARQCKGGLVVSVGKKRYMAHRVIWAITYGAWPQGDIDHIDGNPLNNRLENLRDVPHQVNLENQKKAHRRNKTGYLGVSWHASERKYRAVIQVAGKAQHLGYFATPEEASDCYLSTKREVHAGCTI